MFAFSYFYDRTETFKEPFPNSLQVKDYLNEANKFCSKSLKDEALEDVFKNNQAICMDLSYIYTLLTEGFEFADSQTLSLAKKIKGYETGWCMGAMMKVLDDHQNICPI